MPQKEINISNATFTLKSLIISNKKENYEIWNGIYLDLPVIIKKYDIDEQREDVNRIAKMEIFNLMSMSHQNFIRLLHFVEDDKNVFLILENCECKLSDVNISSEKEYKSFAKNIIKLLKFMEENDMSHNRIDPQNIMFKRGPNGAMIPKLINFSDAEIGQPKTSDIYGASQVLFYAACKNTLNYNNATDMRIKLWRAQAPLSDNSKFLLATLLQPMLSDDRPPASALIKHIYLASTEDVLQFINGCKSALMGGCRSEFKLEIRCSEVTNTDWKNFEHMRSLMDGRRYESSVTDLIRLIRNKTEHPAHYIPNPMSNPDEFLGFFTKQFPTLIAWTWHVMFTDYRADKLERFYPENHNFVAQVPIEKILFN